MPEPSACPFCGQPLVNQTAVKHLHRSEEKYQAELRGRLTEEANAAAEEKVEKAHEAASARASAKVAKAEKLLEKEQEKVAKLKSRSADELSRLKEKIRDEVEKKQSARERRLEKTVERLGQQNEELERRVDGLNAPDRGDMNEADIFNRLVEAFPEDEITRTGKGGDIVEIVRYSNSHELEQAGVILYECKDTLKWSNGFISQIKADGHAHQTPYLLLVSRTLPRGEKGTSVRDEVVIADPAHALPMARILRRMAIEAHCAGLAGQDHAGKTACLYEYLHGDEFREELAAMVESSSKLAEMLHKERQAHERAWTKRQQAYDELGRNSLAIEETIRGIIESEGPAKAPRHRQRPRSKRGSHAERV